MKRSILRHLTVLIGVVAGVNSAGRTNPPEPANPVVSIRFAGFDKIDKNNEGTTFQAVRKFPETETLSNKAMDGFSRFLAARFSAPAATPQSDVTDLVRQLIGDLPRHRSYLELIDSLDWRFAIQLPEVRARFWEANCAKILRHLNDASGNNNPPFAFRKSGDWILVLSGSGMAASSEDSDRLKAFASRLHNTGQPDSSRDENWLSVSADLSRLRERWPNPIPSNAASLTAHIRGRESSLKTEATLRFSESISWRDAEWKIPVNLIGDPSNTLMSFTAVQGIAPVLNRSLARRNFPMNSVPDQFFAWGNSSAPFQIQAAVPVASAANWVRRIAEDRLPVWNEALSKNSVGQLKLLPGSDRLLWRSLPMLTPYLRGARDSGQDYLLGGVFEIPPSTNPPPSELISQLTGRKNLLYYNWEITQARLFQLRSLIPYVSLVTTLPNLGPKSAASAWFNVIAPKLGNTVTEISVASPTTVSFSRTSHIGLNAFELVALAYWLESPDFPKAAFKIDFRPIPSPIQP